MKDIRIGNDITIQWSLFNGDAQFPIEGLDLHVYLKDKFGRKEIEDFQVRGNQITWTFYGKDQRRIGVYSMEVIINEGEEGMITTDACQFVNLVPCSCSVKGSDPSDVQTETIEITSVIEIGNYYDDTEVKNELARLEREKADKSELTELSAEVSGLSEKIENLPSGESSVFEAEHGVTTYDEVVEAKNTGKFVICIKDRLTYHLSYVSEDLAYFTTIRGNVSYYTYINKATNKWTDGLSTLEQLSNKTTTISESSTDTQYPSAKAVYDAVEAVKEKDYELLLDVTMESDVESFNASAVAPRLLECKDFIVLIEFLYDENTKNRSGYIHFKNGSSFPSARIENVVTASYLTHYILRIHLGKGFDKTASIESHTNAWGNPQYGTPKGNIMGVPMSDAHWDMFDFQFGFFANEKIMIYGK